jgi:hypothetical protein
MWSAIPLSIVFAECANKINQDLVFFTAEGPPALIRGRTPTLDCGSIRE